MKIIEFFTGFLEHKQAQGLCQKSLHDYKVKLEKILKPSIGYIEVEDLKEIDADKIIMQGRNFGEFGDERGIVCFRQLLQYLKKIGVKAPIDWRDIKLPHKRNKEVDTLTKEEWEEVRKAFNLQWIVGLRDRALCEMLWCSGMRISEVLSLNRQDIKWEDKEAKVMNAKSKEIEKVYFTDEALYWLRQYLQMRNENFDPLFVSMTGQRATPCGVRRTIAKAVRKAGIMKRVHPHLFRSTFCTELLERGLDIKSVQYLARHKSERTTLKHYIKINKQRAKSEHQRVLNIPIPQVEVNFVKEFMFKSSTDLTKSIHSI